MQAKESLLFLEKNLIVMTKFPDISLTLVKCPKFPDIFSKFPDLEKILFFPDFSLTRGNPVNFGTF